MFKPGDQIAYIPLHANGSLEHKDVEFGFVTSLKGEFVFCRFYYPDRTLRTKDNSEPCNPDNLVPLPKEHLNYRDEAEIKTFLMENGYL